MSGAASPWYARRSAAVGGMLVSLATAAVVVFHLPWEEPSRYPHLPFDWLFAAPVATVGGLFVAHELRNGPLDDLEGTRWFLTYPMVACAGVAVPASYLSVWHGAGLPPAMTYWPSFLVGTVVGIFAESARWE